MVDSWKYMSRKHCDQSHTLAEIPKQEVVVIDKSNSYLNINLEVTTISNKIASQKASLFFSLLFSVVYLIFLIYISAKIHFGYHLLVLGSIKYIPKFIFWTISDYKEHLDIKNNVLSLSLNDKKWGDSIPLHSIKNISYSKSSRYWFYNAVIMRKNKDEEFYTLKFTLKDKTKHKFLVTKKTIERIKSETNLLKQFDKGYLASSAFNQKIEQHTA